MKWIVGLIIAIVLIIILSGCAATPIVPEPLPDTAARVLTKFVLAPDMFFTLCIVGIMAGVFAFLNGQKIGIPLIITCFTGMCMKLAVVRFGFWIGLCGAIGSLTLLVYTIIIKDRALKEIITGVEDYRSVIIEPNSIDDRLNTAQKSKSTKKLVRKIKEKLL